MLTNFDGGFGRLLQSKTISGSLTILAMVTAVLGTGLIGFTIFQSNYSISQMELSRKIADEALYSVILEKDFASLERDAMRHALEMTRSSQKAYQDNVADLNSSIAEMRQKSAEDAQVLALLDNVDAKADIYTKTVANELANGVRPDRAGAVRIAEAGAAVDDAIEAIREPILVRDEAQHDGQLEEAWIGMIIAGVFTLLVSGIIYCLVKGIMTNISLQLGSVSGAISRIEAGELNVDIDYLDRTDDVGDLARSASRLRDTTRAKLEAEESLREMVDSVGDALRQVAKGDLTTELGDLGADYERLRGDFNDAMVRLREAMDAVANASGSIQNNSVEIRAASNDLAQRTEKNAAQLSEAADSIAALSNGLVETANGASSANQSVNDAMSEARQGGDIICRAVAAMESIEKSAAEINNIIAVIDSISFQTNLLALNAGVEAARAGDAGNGFAVVAQEVRSLAQRSSEAAQNIRQLIEGSVAEIASGAEMVRDAGGALDRIIERVTSVSDLVSTIESDSSQQSERLRETSEVMSAMDRMTQQNAAMVEQNTAAARSLSSEADRMTELVSHFSVGKVSTSNLPSMMLTSDQPKEEKASEVVVVPQKTEPAPKAAAPKPVAQPKPTPAPAPAPVVSGNLAMADPDEDWSEF